MELSNVDWTFPVVLLIIIAGSIFFGYMVAKVEDHIEYADSYNHGVYDALNVSCELIETRNDSQDCFVVLKEHFEVRAAQAQNVSKPK